MLPEEFKAKTKEILSKLDDQGAVSTVLAELVQDYDNTTAEKESALSQAQKLVHDNEKLRAANMDLFLKIGEPEKKEDKAGPEDLTPKFETLFDDKGNLL